MRRCWPPVRNVGRPVGESGRGGGSGGAETPTAPDVGFAGSYRGTQWRFHMSKHNDAMMIKGSAVVLVAMAGAAQFQDFAGGYRGLRSA